MAEDGAIRVADLLPERLQLGPAVETAVREEPGAAPPGLPLGFIGEQAEAALRGLLDCDVIELLAEGWLKARALQDYADPAKHPPGETSIVHLADHKFVREIHPLLELAVGGCPPVRVRFTVELAAQLRGVALSIGDGRIKAVALGDASVSAQLKYGEVALTDEKESKKLKLPGRHVFAPPGLKIPPPRGAGESGGADESDRGRE